MTSLIPRSMAASLFLTLALEVSAAFILGVKGKRDLAVVALAQLATNPAVVITTLFMYLRFGMAGRLAALAVLEPLAVISEALIYKKSLGSDKIRPILLSLALNGISFAAGELINFL